MLKNISAKILVLVLAISMLVTKVDKKNEIVLAKVLYIHYPLRSCKNKKNKIYILINFANKINVIMLIYILKLDFKIYCINFRA